MRKIFTIVALAALSIGGIGCSRRPHSAPPTERLALTIRFFRSVQSGDSAAAARQGRKLYMLDTRQDYILHLVSVQESNEAVGEARKLLLKGRINEALPIVSRAIRQYPDNRTLVSTYPKLVQLRNAEKLLKAMRDARQSSAMRGARIAARVGLSRNLTPAFNSYLEAYEKRERQVAERERKTIEKADQKATVDAKAALDADRKRAEADAQFQQNTSAKAAEGERVRKAAGEVPFEPGENPAPAPPATVPTAPTAPPPASAMPPAAPTPGGAGRP